MCPSSDEPEAGFNPNLLTLVLVPCFSRPGVAHPLAPVHPLLPLDRVAALRQLRRRLERVERDVLRGVLEVPCAQELHPALPLGGAADARRVPRRVVGRDDPRARGYSTVEARAALAHAPTISWRDPTPLRKSTEF